MSKERQSMMTRVIILAGAYCAIGVASIWADDKKVVATNRLPKPLNDVASDFGVLEQRFKVVENKYYPAREFTVDGRVVAEETIVWVLEAKEAIKGDEVYQ